MITLISPPKLYSLSSQFYIGRGGAPPLNLAYLARSLFENDIQYDVIDTLATNEHFLIPDLNIEVHGLSFEKIIERINPNTKVVGISSMFTNEYLIVRKLCLKIREKLPNVLIILGGEHPTALAEPTLKYDQHVDFIFHGEADQTLVEFMKRLVSGEDLKTTPGIYFRDKETGLIKKNPSLPRMVDLDEHRPLWEKIPVEYYLENKLSLSRTGVRSLPILATRGCPYKCTFCSNEKMWGTRYVMRSIDSVVNEMKDYVKKYKVQHFDFQDLSTSINKKWFKELLLRMNNELPGVTWEMTVGTRSEILDREVLELMMASGTTQLTYAPETGSYEMSKRIQKKINFKKLYESIKIANSLGMEVKSHLIIGFPSETILDLLKTILLALRLGWYGVKGVSIYVFSPYPGSILFEKKYKYMEFTENEYFSYLTYQITNSAGARVFNPKNLVKYPREEILAFIGNVFMVVAYFISMISFPQRFLDIIVNPLRGKPKNPLEIGVYKLLTKLYIVQNK